MMRLLLAAAACVTSALLPLTGNAADVQPYPAKPVRLIVPFPPGAGVDIVSRSVSGPLGKLLGQQVIVDNRSGAGGIVGGELAAKSPADGYTLLMGTAGMLTVVPHLNRNMPYSVERDFLPVSLVASVPSALVVHPSLPVRSVRDLVQLAKAKPGALNYASTGNGTLPHLAAEFFKAQANINMVHVAYKGSAPAITDLLSGQVEVFFGNMLSVVPHVASGRLRALAVTSLKSQAALPGVTTVAAAGYPGFEAGTWFGLLAPAGTTASVVSVLHAKVVETLGQADVRNRLAGRGATTIGNTPAQFATYIRSESEKWAGVLKRSGVKAD